MPVVFVFGNGLSCGLDERLTTRSLTERVLTRLGPQYVDALEDLAALASPEIPDQPLGSCACGTAYLIKTEADGAHCKAAGDAKAIEAQYDALSGPELRLEHERGAFVYKRLG